MSELIYAKSSQLQKYEPAINVILERYSLTYKLFLKQLDKDFNNPYWIILLLNGEIIGMAIIAELDHIHDEYILKSIKALSGNSYNKILSSKPLYICNFVVTEAYRGKGYGTKILNEIINRNSDRNMTLTVNSENIAAIALYKRAAFNQTGAYGKKYMLMYRPYNNEVEECKIQVPFERVLDFKTARKIKYRERKGESRVQLHWGQRKLHLTEIEFLTLHGDRAKIIVYIGSANGTHIAHLTKMFPEHKFHLYDPAPFDPILSKCPNITMYNQLFLEPDIKGWQGKQTLLISDIRTVPKGWSEKETRKDIGKDMENDVKMNMKLQENVYLGMQSEACMLKFRLPWASGETEYLPGEIRFQPWAPQTSTETRLIILKENQKLVKYDNSTYEDICFRFNTCTRTQTFKNFEDYPILSKLNYGVPKSYDLLAEIKILEEYLLKFHIKSPKTLVEQQLRDIEIFKLQKAFDEVLEKTINKKYKEKIIKHNLQLGVV
jgi:ribosomal protein S18 acetylase RimI-like enzyme